MTAAPELQHEPVDRCSAYRRCPLCRGTGGPLDPAQAVAAVQQTLGERA